MEEIILSEKPPKPAKDEPERVSRPRTPKSYWYRYHQEKARDEIRKNAKKVSSSQMQHIKDAVEQKRARQKSKNLDQTSDTLVANKRPDRECEDEKPTFDGKHDQQRSSSSGNAKFINHMFTILDGEYVGLRLALKRRSWLEVPHFMNKNSEMSLDALENLVYRSLRSNRVPTFIWTNSKDLVRSLHRNQIVSKFPTSTFTTKVGLCKCLQDVHWVLSEPCFGQFKYSGAEEFFPRCYIIGGSEDKEPFIRDYMATAYISVVKWVVEKYHPGPVGSGIESPTGEVPHRVITEAQARIRDLIKSWDDVDCAYGDGIQTKNPEFLDQRQFLAFFYKLVHAGAALELTDEENVLALYNECYELIERVEAIWPASKSDGVTNTWIVKPGARSRGRGILVLNKLDSIMQFS
ncbi:unnamed protein product, partial [Notodromas monacha]